MATQTRGPAGAPEAPADPSRHLTPDDRVALLRYMLLMRGIEERAMNLYRQGKVPAPSTTASARRPCRVGAAFAMAPTTGCASCTATSARTSSAASTPARILGQYMGRAGGITGGRDGNVHFGDHRVGCVGMVSMLPDMMLVATGMAMAFKLRGEARCAHHLVRRRLDVARRLPRGDELGRRAAAAGHLRAGEQPVRLLDADSTAQFAVDPVERAAAYGFPGVTRRRQRRRGDVRGDARGARARARRRGPDAASRP